MKYVKCVQPKLNKHIIYSMDTSPTIHFPDVYRRTISNEFKTDEYEEFADTNSETTEINEMNEMSETSEIHEKKTLLQQIYSFFKYYVCYKKKNLLLKKTKKHNKKGFFFYDK